MPARRTYPKRTEVERGDQCSPPRAPTVVTLMVRDVPPEDADRWDALVRSCRGWTPYHLYGWREVIENVHGHECPFMAAYRADGSLAGVLPLVRVRSLLFGHYLVSMPFLNYGGPLGDDDAVRALVSEAQRVAEQRRVGLLEIRSPHPLPLDLVVSHRKVTVLLDLPAGDPEGLWTGLKAKVRSQVRRPIKDGVDVRFGSEELGGFYRVFSRHMRDLGTPVQPEGLFRHVLDRFESEVWVGCAHLRGEPVAAGLGFRWADRFELVWASALREHNRLAPNMLLYWKFMERCCQDGASVFDFGRCTPGSGTHRFKAQWGGRDEQLWWYQDGPKAGGGTPAADSGAYALGPRVWRHLPMPIANALGPLIVRSLP